MPKKPTKRGSGAAAVAAPRTEGQRLLLEVAASQAEVAAAVGASRAAVGFWRRGEKLPGATARAKLKAAYGIDPTAWDRKVGAPASRPAASTASAPTSAPKRLSARASTSTLDEVNEQLEMLRALQRDDELLAGERVRLADSVGKLLAIKARLERDQELLEDRIVRQHPFYARLKGAVLEALKSHPDAARDVAEALAHLEAS